MRKLLPITLAVFVALSFVACEPYDDGPKCSFRSKEERLVNDWALKTVLENEADITAWYDSTIVNLDYDNSLLITYVDDTGAVSYQRGFWEWQTDDKEQIRFDYTSPAQNPDRTYFKILRLKEEELWLDEINDSLVREFRFVAGPSDSI